MSSSALWGTSINGGVYRLSEESSSWDQLTGRIAQVQVFKKISAQESSIWALGGDSLVYIYVHSSDIPIRCRIVTYENQRWNPFGGFSGKKLLPTDRFNWSSEDGRIHLPKEGFELASNYWEWEGDWTIDENIDGEVTDKEGWQYAVDFPAKYFPEKKVYSCVRRRRWIRYRRFTAYDSWAQIPSLNPQNPVEEPFVDVSISGQGLPNLPRGHLCVWAVSIKGKVYIRRNVTGENPEGDAWDLVGVDRLINAVSVGPLGQVWLVTLDGNCLIRMGVSWDCVFGSSWKEIPQPDPRDKFCQLSVGVCAVWAISGQGKVWFRRGVDAKNEYTVIGTSWVEMVGSMIMVSIGSNDQVWGISKENRCMYFRTGVAPDELCGKTWQPIVSKITRKVQTSESISSMTSSDHYITDENSSIQSFKSIDKPQFNSTTCDSVVDVPTTEEIIHSITPCFKPFRFATEPCGGGDEFDSYSDLDASLRRLSSKASLDESRRNEARRQLSRSSSRSSNASDTVVDFVNDFEDDETVETVIYNESIKKNVPSVEDQCSDNPIKNDSEPTERSQSVSVTQADELLYAMNCPSVDEIDATTSSNVAYNLIGSSEEMSDDTGMSVDTIQHTFEEQEVTMNEWFGDDYGADRLQWSCVSGMAVVSEVSAIQKWLKDKVRGASVRPFQNTASRAKAWRKNILKSFKARDTLCETELRSRKYEYAIERTSWKKCGKIELMKDHGRYNWIECTVELETYGEDKCKDGRFTVQYYYKGAQKVIQTLLHDLVCVYRTCQGDVNNGRFVFSVYTAARLTQYKPLKFRAKSEDEMDDWLASLSVACCDVRHMFNTASPLSAWGLTNTGDVFLHESLQCSIAITDLSELYWHQFGGHMKIIQSNSLGIVWGIASDHTAWVYTGAYGGGMLKGVNSSTTGINYQSDVQKSYIYENQRWNPLTGYSDRGLPTDRPMWSDVTGTVALSKDKMATTSKHHMWVSDWTIDYSPTRGAEKEGWQYATDFPAKYQINTSGPWAGVPSLLLDISIQIDPSHVQGASVHVWAIDTSGNVMCRLGVTEDNHRGTQWQHVPTDQTSHSISVGASGRVWILADDNSAWYRNGVTHKSLAGSSWIHVTPPPPNNFRLRQISACNLSVWAVDEKDNLWYRAGVTDTFPEGTQWIMLCNEVKMVSVTPTDQVYAVLTRLDGPGGVTHGVVCRRREVSEENTVGSGWETGIGGDWSYICVRGCANRDK